MPEGQVIGRISIKVLPDTEDFRREAKKKLEAIEKSLKIAIPTTIDMSGASREMLTEIRKINARNKQSDARKIRFYSTISTDGMRAELAKASRELSRRAKQFKVNFDAKVDAATADLNLNLDKESKQHVEQQLRDFVDDNSPLKVQVQPEMMPGAGAVVSARLGVLTRPRTVPIIPKLDNAAVAKVAAGLAALAGVRVAARAVERLKDAFKNLDKNIPLISSIALAVAGIGTSALASTSNLFALSSSLAQIGGAGLALPGMFTGMAIGIGAMVAVLKDFNEVLPEVSKKLSRLQSQMSNNFWSKAEQPMRRMINKLFPEFAKGIRKTATDLGGLFARLSNSLRSELAGKITPMFGHLNKSIRIAGKATDALARIIANLGLIGAKQLPRLSQWMVDLTKDFDDWLNKAANDGRLEGWIDRGIKQMKALGRVTYQFFSILGGIAKAAEAAGGSSLSDLADTLERAAKVVHGKTFQTALTNVLRAAHQSMSNIAEVSGPAFRSMMLTLSRTATRVFPVIGDTIGHVFKGIFEAIDQPKFQTGLIRMFEGINKGVKGFMPALKPMGKAMGDLFSLMGTFARTQGPILAEVFGTLSKAFSKIAPKLEPVIRVLGKGFVKTLQTLRPAFLGIADAIGDLVGSNGFQAVTKGVSVLGPILAHVSKFTLGLVEDLIRGIQDIFDGLYKIVGGFKEVFSGIGKLFKGDFKEGFKQIGSGLKDIFLGALQTAWGAINVWFSVTVLGGIRKLVLKGVRLMGKGLKAVWDAIVNWFKGGGGGGLIGTITNVVKRIAPAVMRGLKSVPKAFMKIWNTVRTGVTKAFGWVAKGVSKGFGKVRKIIGTIGAGIRKVASTIWDAITRTASRAWNALRKVASKVWGAIKTVIGAQLQAARKIATTIWDAMRKVASTVWGAIRSVASKVWGAIKKVISAELRGLRKIATTIWNAMRKVASTVWNAIKKVVSTVLNAISKVVSRVLSTIRQIFSRGWNAVKSVTSSVLGAVGRIIGNVLNGAKRIASSAVGAIKGVIRKGWETIRSVTSSIWDSLKRIISRAWDKIKGIIDKVAGAVKTVTDSIGKIKSAIGKIPSKIPIPNIPKLPFKMPFSAAPMATTLDITPKVSEPRFGTMDVKPLATAAARSGSGLLDGFSGNETKGVEDLGRAFQKLARRIVKGAKRIREAYSDVNKKLAKMVKLLAETGVSRRFQQNAEKRLKNMRKVHVRWNQHLRQLERAKEQLKTIRQEMRSYAEGVRDSVIATGDFTKLEYAGFKNITYSLREAVKNATEFQHKLKRLRDAGLNQTALDQLAQAGVEGGLEAARELVKQIGKGGIKEINQLQETLAKRARATGKIASKAMFQNGVDMAEGLVKGLRKRTDRLENLMRKMANTLVRVIKKRLRIHSPSRVMQDIGAFTVEGFEKGIRTKPMADTGKDMVDSLVDGMESRYGTVKRALKDLNKEVDSVELAAPLLGDTKGLSKSLKRSVSASLKSDAPQVVEQKILNYYAAENHSLPEEDLFAAAGRARMVGF